MAVGPPLKVAAAAVGVALVLGFGAAAIAEQGDGDKASTTTTSPDFGPDGPDASDRPDPALSGQPVPTLPPGDPGTESGTSDPDGDETDGSDGDDGDDGDGGHGDPVTEVPESALVDPQTVGDLAGGSWSVDPAAAEACTTGPAAGATASRSVTLTDAAGHLVQTVSAHADKRAAKAAVPVVADRLVACGFAPAGDPRLGDASAQLTRTSATGGEAVAVVIAADGVSVVLVASGSAAAAGTWESLADVAMGTSCAAAADACH